VRERENLGRFEGGSVVEAIGEARVGAGWAMFDDEEAEDVDYDPRGMLRGSVGTM
jgi:hypothetical protein